MLILRSMYQMQRTFPFETPRSRKILSDLKCCPLCGSVNSRRNKECVTCGWRGKFDATEESIRNGLLQLVEYCPELSGLLRQSGKRRRSWVQKVKSLFKRRLDTLA